MSDKFNRNDANTADDQFYIGDYQTDINGLEEDHRLGLGDFHQMPCIISGLAVTLDSDALTLDISAGIAYDNSARRINMIGSTGEISPDITLNAINYICLAHDDAYSSPRNAYRTGLVYNALKSDFYQLVAVAESEGPPAALEAAGYVVLATTTGTGTSLTISSIDRTSPDFGGAEDVMAPPQVTGITLATGSEISLIYPVILGQFVPDDIPSGSFITVAWNQVSDPSGILRYEIEMVPLDGSNNELPDYLESAVVAYNQA